VKTGDCASHVFSDGAVQRELVAYIMIELGAARADARANAASEALWPRPRPWTEEP